MSDVVPTPQERIDALRGGLFSIWARWDSVSDSPHLLTPLARAMARAMAREALQSLLEAYPDDLFYTKLLADMEAAAQAAACTPRGEG